MVKSVKSLVYRALKMHPRLRFEDLVMMVITLARRRVSREEIADVIEHEILAGYIDMDTEGRIYIVIMLDPIPKPPSGVWDYESIVQGSPIPVAKAEELTEKYLNPLVTHLPHRGQGNAGTCTGQGTVQTFDLMYMCNTCDIPTDHDKSLLTRNTKGKNTWYDKYYPQSFSAACLYYDGRRLGYVTTPSGGYIEHCLLAAKKEGVCRDWQWVCPKDGLVDFKVAYPGLDPENGELCEETKKKYRIDGYAKIGNDIESVKRAVYNEGSVVGAYYMYDNLPTIANSGKFNKITNRVIGAHAVTIVGWTEDGWLIILNSWWDSNWPKLNYVSPEYHKFGGIYFMTAVMKESATIARTIYRHVNIVTNRAARIYIGGDLLATTTGGGSVGAELKIRETYTVRAECVADDESIEKIVEVTADTKYIEMLFKDEDDVVEPPVKPGFEEIVARLKARFKEMMERFRKRFSSLLGGG